MPIRQQGDRVMKNSDIFPEGVEQNISRRENGMLKLLYKVQEKPDMDCDGHHSGRTGWRRENSHLQKCMGRLHWCLGNRNFPCGIAATTILLCGTVQDTCTPFTVQWSSSPERNCVFQPSRMRVALLEIYLRVRTGQLKFLGKPVKGHTYPGIKKRA